MSKPMERDISSSGQGPYRNQFTIMGPTRPVADRMTVEVGMAWFFHEVGLEPQREEGVVIYAISCSACDDYMYPLSSKFYQTGSNPLDRISDRGAVYYDHTRERWSVDFECSGCGQVDRVTLREEDAK